MTAREPALDRRSLLGAGLVLLATPLAGLASAAAPRLRRLAVAPDLASALAASPLVYVSPLRSDGSESTCHGEVWYAWLDDAVVVTTASSTWKARAVERGLDWARIWVGDYGPWKRTLGRNEGFRKGPSFDARAQRSRDAALNERLLASFEKKYPEEIGRWRDRMRKGFASGERVLLRYLPLTAAGPRT